MKILLVEDEVRAAAYIQQGLTENGFAVEVAHTGVDGLHLAANGDHDLVILDVMLPGIDGFALLTALRTTPYAAAALGVGERQLQAGPGVVRPSGADPHRVPRVGVDLDEEHIFI